MKEKLFGAWVVVAMALVVSQLAARSAQAGFPGCGNGAASCNNNGVCAPFVANGCPFAETRLSCRDCRRCGDGVLDIGEGCDDGNRVNGDGCDASCKNEDPCVVHSAPGISDPTVQACVCALRSECCTSGWTLSCVQFGEVSCNTRCDCRSHPPTSIYPFPSVNQCICEGGGGGQFPPDPYCCTSWWDDQCIAEAQLCGIVCH